MFGMKGRIMIQSRDAVAAFLILALVLPAAAGLGPDQEKRAEKDRTALGSAAAPRAIGGKSRPVDEPAKRRFPWLLVGGAVVLGGLAAVLILTGKKKASNQPAATGSIRAESTPSGASIYLDWKDTRKTTDDTLSAVPPGSHIVRLDLDGYMAHDERVTVSAGATVSVKATLVPLVARDVEMVRLPGGTFLMGSDSSEATLDEQPIHRVTVSSFAIGKYEVTQEEWVSVMGSNPSNFRGDRLPVEQVSWNNIQVYIQKLNARTGKRYRLPTEAEWEYACRAGTTEDRYGFLDSVAWTNRNAGESTHEVGRRDPNAFGLYDMLGNVREWIADYWGAYEAGPAVDPKGPAAGSGRVWRGGSWAEGDQCARSPYRYYYDPSRMRLTIGFRLAAD
jgi:formylglycine-generating enzyme required for sulfatase activity